jgi:uncharacterized protein (DUF924 family)
MSIEDVYAYWFGKEPTNQAEIDAKNKLWFGGSPETDAEIRTRFGALVERARAGKLDDWHATPKGSLAWLILVDQFSRNIYRNRPEAFAYDSVAQTWAHDGFESGKFQKLSTIEQLFGALPFEHAEDLEAQRYGVARVVQIALQAPPLLEAWVKMCMDYARKHLDVIARFDRFPHRNAVLSRESTPDELAYLAYCKRMNTWL